MEVVTKSAQETQKLGEKIANNLKKSASQRIFALYGELGSGKTTFIQGLAKGLGIKERILSPTFILMREYVISNKQNVSRVTCHMSRFYHVDLYRIESERDVESLGLEEIWNDPQNVVAIEWAEKIKKILPKKRTEIHFKYLKDNERKIVIND